MKPVATILLFMILHTAASAQKQLPAHRIDEAITIDGALSEPGWQQADVATGFTQTSPNPGKPATLPAEVKVLYDDGALYVGAMLYDPNPDSILKELTLRDNLGNSDYFGVLLNPYRDGINGTGFRVTAAGVQLDDKFSSLGEDPSFDLVWESEISITDSGWVVEMRIPYSAIRFSNKEVQQWSINFIRYIRRIREENWWNEVKPDVEGMLTQTGTLTGLKDIVAPVRLSLAPYLSGYYDINTDPGRKEVITDTRFNGGMDLKYGINEAFTLDMTLVPDFGQVEFDEQVLNLSPFEVQFEERRQFFTEGIELFNRGGIFYSRRIGGDPFRHDRAVSQLGAGDSIIRNPGRSQLINATKVSGRNNNNLGIGFFNAVEDRMHATVVNEDDEQREEPTNPLTNYNIMVLDQGLPNNSYVSLINTNVWREGAAYDANVTATEFEVRDKGNEYRVAGGANLSQKYFSEADPELGLQYRLEGGKISGNFQFNYYYYVADDTYDPNDLGFLNNNNERNTSLSLGYNIYEPKGRLLNMQNSLTISYNRLYKPDKMVAFGLAYDNFTTFTNFHSIGGNISTYPVGYNDYFEPRTPGYFYHIPDNYHFDFFVSPDYRLDFLADIQAGMTLYNEEGRMQYFYTIRPRIRFSDQLFVIYQWNHTFYDNDIGFATKLDDRIIFGKRDQQTVEQTIDGSFIFNNKMGIQLKLRHYWSVVKYEAYYDLQPSGEVEPNAYTGTGPDGNSLHNTNYNAFTIDLGYTWRFAPGSDMSLVWKNAIFESGDDLAKNYVENIRMLANYPKFNGFSLKILYYLDYLMVRNAFNSRQ